MQQGKMEEGTPKIVFADVYLGEVKPADLGLKRLYGAMLDSKRKGLVAPVSSIVEPSQ